MAINIKVSNFIIIINKVSTSKKCGTTEICVENIF